jgi:hypothetical protein
MAIKHSTPATADSELASINRKDNTSMAQPIYIHHDPK